jgi:hypothetical protein
MDHPHRRERRVRWTPRCGRRRREPDVGGGGAARARFGTSEGVPEPSVWSLQHPVVTTVGMSVILLGVMVPLAVRRYSRVAR